MNKEIKNVIDDFIRLDAVERDGQYQIKNIAKSKNVKSTILDLFDEDEAFRRLITLYIRPLVNERIDIVYSEDKYDAGFTPYIDQQTGEPRWGKIA